MTIPRITIEQAKIMFSAVEANMKLANELIDKANEIALAEQQESEYITAAQARELGAGNAEYSYSGEIWDICDSSCKYSITHNNGLSMTKYRAIKQAQPESVGPHAALRAEYIRQRDAVPCELRFYLWEFGGIGLSWIKCDAAFLFIPVYQYRCTDISCYISKDGKPATRMLRTEAQELQRKLGDTVEWFDPKNSKPAFKEGFKFSMDGTYTYRTKATIKLNGNMVTPEQAAAEWRAKKDTHEFWYKHSKKPNFYIPDGRDFIAYALVDSEYELRPKPAKVAVWTGSREDVIALLKEMGVL